MVVDDLPEALRLVASGENVVLVLAEGVDPGPLPVGPGRVAVMVGDIRDPATRDAADAMHAELFGAGRTRATGSDSTGNV